MPKSINPKQVEGRIKGNLKIARESKKLLSDAVNELLISSGKHNPKAVKKARNHLTAFCNAMKAIAKDTAKLPKEKKAKPKAVKAPVEAAPEVSNGESV